MGKRIDIEPRWLVSLLNQWAIHDLRTQTGGLGYASGSSWMRGLKSSPASSIDPTGFAARDFRDVEAALDDLRQKGTNLWAALMMYYKPWVVQSFRNEGYPFANSTYYDRLHRAHAEVALAMGAVKASGEKRLSDFGRAGDKLGFVVTEQPNHLTTFHIRNINVEM